MRSPTRWSTTIDEDGSDRVIWDQGPGISLGTQTAGNAALSVLLDSTGLDMNTEIGDGHRGVGETFGKILFERSADDYFFSDMIVCWGSNPYYTQIPNAHFLTEARYNGAQIVCITPDFNAIIDPRGSLGSGEAGERRGPGARASARCS